jgi:hypothetical protein
MTPASPLADAICVIGLLAMAGGIGWRSDPRSRAGRWLGLVLRCLGVRHQRGMPTARYSSCSASSPGAPARSGTRGDADLWPSTRSDSSSNRCSGDAAPLTAGAALVVLTIDLARGLDATAQLDSPVGARDRLECESRSAAEPLPSCSFSSKGEAQMRVPPTPERGSGRTGRPSLADVPRKLLHVIGRPPCLRGRC